MKRDITVLELFLIEYLVVCVGTLPMSYGILLGSRVECGGSTMVTVLVHYFGG
jgi:hypothetical protein